MAKPKNAAVTPRLRFPAFQTDWTAHSLGRFLTESRMPGNDGSVAKKLTVKLWGNGVVAKNETISGSAGTQYYKRQAGQFIYSKLDFLNGAFGVVPDHLDGFESTIDLPCFDVVDGFDREFLREYVSRPEFYKRFGEVADGGRKAKRIQVESFLSFPVAVPESADEQRKIAECLTSLDDVIAAQAQKVAALKVHKQGLMQQLFPRQGETVPRLRFPEFRDGPVWTEKKAGSLFSNHVERGEPGLPIYSVTINDGMVRRSSFDRDFGDIEEPAGNKKACRGDIAYNTMRMWQGAIGVAVEECLVSPAYVVLTPNTSVVSEFFVYFFKLTSSLLLLTSHSRGLTKDRLRLYYEDFARIIVFCPSRAEQQRIADCLSSIDGEITTHSARLDSLRSHKAALVQQLFPAAGN